MNLFVAKLSPTTTPQDLQKLFAHYGFVHSVKVIKDHFTGRSKGYGFVEMPNVEEAVEALKELDCSLFKESVINVKNSQPAPPATHPSRNQYQSNISVRSWSKHDYIRSATTNPRYLQDQNSSRNFGNRGSGYKD